MTDTQEILKKLERIEKALKVTPKKTWVKVSIITDVTGWKGSKLEKMVDNGLVERRVTEKDKKKSYEYLLESIHPMFVKSNSLTT